MLNPAPYVYPPDFERRTVEEAKKILDDIAVCRDAEYQVRFLGDAPVLILAFSLPETIHQPAFCLRLVTISQSEPLRRGQLVEGDRLKRKLREHVEHYLHKHGVRIPVLES